MSSLVCDIYSVYFNYCFSLNLILVTSDVVCSDTQLRYLLDLVFNSMVLMVGLHLLETDAANTEKLKRELKVRGERGERCVFVER